jgi:hypothetical protein
MAPREANLGKPITDENNNNRLDTDFIGYPTRAEWQRARQQAQKESERAGSRT